MRILYISFTCMIACGVNGSELVKGTDPITGDKYQLEKKSIGAWEVLTFPEASENLLMASKNKKPVISASKAMGTSSVTVHDPKNSALTSVDIYDNNNDGVYDHIRVYQQDGTHGFIDLKLIQGKWQYKEYSSSDQ